MVDLNSLFEEALVDLLSSVPILIEEGDWEGLHHVSCAIQRIVGDRI